MRGRNVAAHLGQAAIRFIYRNDKNLQLYLRQPSVYTNLNQQGFTMKKPFSFRLSDCTASYLRSVVKSSGLTMTQYLEMLVETDRDRSPAWERALVIQDGRASFASAEEYSALLCEAVTGDSILGCIPNTVVPTSELVFLVLTLQKLGICEESNELSFKVDTDKFISAVEHHTGICVKDSILDY